MTRISNDYSKVPERYQSDVKEIVEACLRRGLVVTPEEAYSAWGNYSEAYAAGWLGLPYPGQAGEVNISKEDCDCDIERIVEIYSKI